MFQMNVLHIIGEKESSQNITTKIIFLNVGFKLDMIIKNNWYKRLNILSGQAWCGTCTILKKHDKNLIICWFSPMILLSEF